MLLDERIFGKISSTLEDIVLTLISVIVAMLDDKLFAKRKRPTACTAGRGLFEARLDSA